MISLDDCQTIIVGPYARELVSTEVLVRLLGNVNQYTLSAELVARVEKKEMSYLAFTEEAGELRKLVTPLFGEEDKDLEEMHKLLKVLNEGYRLAEIEVKRLNLTGI